MVNSQGFATTFRWVLSPMMASLSLESILDKSMHGFVLFAGKDRCYLVLATRLGLSVLETATLQPIATLCHHGAISASVRKDGLAAATMGRDPSVGASGTGSPGLPVAGAALPLKQKCKESEPFSIFAFWSAHLV